MAELYLPRAKSNGATPSSPSLSDEVEEELDEDPVVEEEDDLALEFVGPEVFRDLVGLDVVRAEQRTWNATTPC